jgi:photosystem II PsbY protein
VSSIHSHDSKLMSMHMRTFCSAAAGLGLGAASLLAAESAEAAQQVADLAAGDSRVGILAFLALPALG